MPCSASTRLRSPQAARDNGAPGKQSCHPGYYGAYVLDPDGNDIEAVYHGPFEHFQAPSVVFAWDKPE